MSRLEKKNERRQKIKKSIRRKVRGTQERPRLSVFRSNRGIYAQIIDDIQGITLASASLMHLEGENIALNLDSAKEVGKLLAKNALEKGLKQVVFDRNGYLYHGRIKALAEGAREGGLEF
ncbi:MAG: 50S ribosomal protein L18 [Microscillaceae bacterium]|nr:50S ribosomal protein L18 [Microscillaceae bacterium]